MIRPLKTTLLLCPLALLIAFSFIGGRKLRQVAAAPILENARVTSLPEAKIGGILGLGARQGDTGNPAKTFQEIYNYIRDEYVDKVESDAKLSHGALRAMLASLDDPRTRYLEPAQLKALEEQLNGKYAGIGATVSVVKAKKGSIEYRRLAVVAPAPGGPAALAGVQPGDVITHVNDRWIIAYDPRLELDQIQTKEMTDAEYRKSLKDLTKKITDGVSLPKALEMLVAADGKKVELTVERVGATAPLKLAMTTSTVTVAPVEVKLISDSVAHIRIPHFGPSTASALTDALKEAGSRSLIIDLRDNPGTPVPADKTLPEAARILLAATTKGGKVGNLALKGNKSDAIIVGGTATSAPKIAVLVNGGTSNVAELVASALKERAGATLVGGKTFGDAILQRLVNLRSGGAMTVSAGKYLTSNGSDFNGKGLQPDITVTGTAGAANDPAVQRAVSVLAGA